MLSLITDYIKWVKLKEYWEKIFYFNVAGFNLLFNYEVGK